MRMPQESSDAQYNITYSMYGIYLMLRSTAPHVKWRGHECLSIWPRLVYILASVLNSMLAYYIIIPAYICTYVCMHQSGSVFVHTSVNSHTCVIIMTLCTSSCITLLVCILYCTKLLMCRYIDSRRMLI